MPRTSNGSKQCQAAKEAVVSDIRSIITAVRHQPRRPTMTERECQKQAEDHQEWFQFVDPYAGQNGMYESDEQLQANVELVAEPWFISSYEFSDSDEEGGKRRVILT